ncbi:MAG TPA: tol-pal system protein YbgF [Steroidobacteraceae bacterium]|nr:tol-pal system protein YbgF [Steroidobacteraceae bacterium]
MSRALRIATCLLAGFAASAAHAQSKGERLDLLESRMEAAERQLSNQGLLEISRQIDLLNGELRTLRGEIDTLQHELERSRTQQRDQYVDLDTRLRAAEAALTAAAPQQAASGTPEAEYQAAFDLLKNGRYDEAAVAFGEFHARNPQHELAPNALYWLGEAHYVRRDYAAALAAFEGLMRDYPGTRKAPDALLKSGYCQFEMKQAVAARATLNRVVQEFPDSPAAVEAKARLDRIGTQGG